MAMSRSQDLLDDLRAGRMIVLVDDEDRENEGDLVFAAQSVTPEKINFLLVARAGRALPRARRDDLRAARAPPPDAPSRRTGSAPRSRSRSRPLHGVTTGISAKDRATTILAAVSPEARPTDLARPGHVHPLRAQPGGVLVRPGQTEGSVDLCRLAGLRPAAVIMEVLNEDGTLARRPELDAFCTKHGIRMGSIADLIAYRRKHERPGPPRVVRPPADPVRRLRPARLPVALRPRAAPRDHARLGASPRATSRPRRSPRPCSAGCTPSASRATCSTRSAAIAATSSSGRSRSSGAKRAPASCSTCGRKAAESASRTSCGATPCRNRRGWTPSRPTWRSDSGPTSGTTAPAPRSSSTSGSGGSAS